MHDFNTRKPPQAPRLDASNRSKSTSGCEDLLYQFHFICDRHILMENARQAFETPARIDTMALIVMNGIVHRDSGCPLDAMRTQVRAPNDSRLRTKADISKPHRRIKEEAGRCKALFPSRSSVCISRLDGRDDSCCEISSRGWTVAIAPSRLDVSNWSMVSIFFTVTINKEMMEEAW